ncbi:MAG: hypothetical protein ABH864_00590 [archaeon]
MSLGSHARRPISPDHPPQFEQRSALSHDRKSGFRIFRGHNAELVNHLFQTLLVTYLILLLAEQLWEGIVSVYLNLNWLLIVVIVMGVLDVFSDRPPRRQERVKGWDYVFVSVLGVVGFVIIKYKTVDLGWLSWAISLIAGALIILLSMLVLEEKDEN